MNKSVLVAVITGLIVLLGACGGGTAATTTTSSTEPAATSTTVVVTTSTTGTTLPVGVFETVLHEQTERRFTYSGEWKTSNAQKASGGSFAFVDEDEAALTVRFIGSELTWIAKKSAAYGEAEVTLDGSSFGMVDLYSAEDLWQQTVWETGTLSAGPHVVTIAWTGEKSEAATDTNINVDSIEVRGVLTGRYQQTNEKLVYAGEWKATSDQAASGQNFGFANSAGASVTIHFYGVAIGWLAKTSPVYGLAKVTVDGGEPVTVDLYSADALWRQEVWNSGTLGMGPHTVKIEWTGSKNSAATNTNINIDYFDITGTLE